MKATETNDATQHEWPMPGPARQVGVHAKHWRDQAAQESLRITLRLDSVANRVDTLRESWLLGFSDAGEQVCSIIGLETSADNVMRAVEALDAAISAEIDLMIERAALLQQALLANSEQS